MRTIEEVNASGRGSRSPVPASIAFKFRPHSSVGLYPAHVGVFVPDLLVQLLSPFRRESARMRKISAGGIDQDIEVLRGKEALPELVHHESTLPPKVSMVLPSVSG